MRYKITIMGDEAEDVLGILRDVGADKDVDIVETHEPSADPLDDIVFYQDRITNHLMRISSNTRYLRNIDTKMGRIAAAAERMADSAERMERIERDRRDEEVLNLRK